MFERAGVAGHQRLARDHVTYRDLATNRQQRVYYIVREHHGLTVSRVNRHHSDLPDALRPVPKFVVGGWAWAFNRAATIGQGAKIDTGTKELKAKLSPN